jgi:hypothetical protein
MVLTKEEILKLLSIYNGCPNFKQNEFIITKLDYNVFIMYPLDNQMIKLNMKCLCPNPNSKCFENKN